MKVRDDKKELLKIRFKDRDFHKASGSIIGPDRTKICVMVAHKGGAVAVRDSKDSSKKTLIFSEAEWKVFLEGVKAGEFDL